MIFVLDNNANKYNKWYRKLNRQNSWKLQLDILFAPITDCLAYAVYFGAYASAYTYIKTAFYASWIFSGLLSSLLHSGHSGGITRRPTTLLVTEIALPRLLMGKGMRGIHRGFIEETMILEERWNLARLACAKVQHSTVVPMKRLGSNLEWISTLFALFSTRTI